MSLPQVEIDSILKFFPQGVVAIDLETSGLSPFIDKIIEIGCTKITAKGEVETFSELVNPEVPISPDTILIHGITDLMVEESANIKEVLPRLREFCEQLPLVAHNAKFDLGFIMYDLFEQKSKWPGVDVYCSCQMARRWIKSVKNHRLGTLCESLDIPLENAHRADDDALACLRVFAQALKNKYDTDNENLTLTSNEGKLFNLSEFDFTKEIKLPTHLKLLEDTLKSHSKKDLEIKYSGGSMKNQFRPVKPVSIIPLPNGLMLYALCLKTDLYKNFSLNKIKDVREIKQAGQNPQ